MQRLPEELLRRMAAKLSCEDRDEMAIPSYLHPNPAARWMAWRRLEVIADDLRRNLAFVGDVKSAIVMDFGCGTGVLFEEALQGAARVYGVDLVLEAAELLVEERKLHECVTLLKPDGAKEEIADQSLDIVIAAEVLEHFEEGLEEPLQLFRDKLKPEGTLLVSLPTESALYRMGRRIAGFKGHYHHQNARSIHAEITRFGFREKKISQIPAPGPFSIYWVIEYGV